VSARSTGGEPSRGETLPDRVDYQRVDYRMVAEQCLDPLLEVRDGIVHWIGSSVQTTLGWAPTEIESTPLVGMCHPDERADLLSLLGRVAEGQAARGVFRLRVKGGGFLWALLSLGPGSVESGSTRSVGSIREINVRVEAEHRLRLIVEHASNVLCTTGRDRRVTWVSSNVTRLLGWTSEGLVGTFVGDIVHSLDRPGFDHRLGIALGGDSGGEPLSDVLLRVRRRDGSYAWSKATWAVLLDGLGTPSGAICGFSDVDDLVTAQGIVRRDTFRSQLIVDSLLNPHIVLRPVRDDYGRTVDFVYVDINRAACEYVGVERDEIIGHRLARLLPGDAPSVLMDLYTSAMETGEPLVLDDFQYRSAESNGSGRHFEIRAIRVDDSLSVVWRDKTDQLSAIAALTSSEEQYRLLAVNSSDVVVRWRDDAIAWVSPSLTAMLGWLPEQWVGGTYADLLHPDDRVGFTADRADLVGGLPRVHRYRLRDSQLCYHWVEEHARAYLDAQGKPDGLVGSFRTIDDEVAAEAEMERRAQYDALTGLLNRQEILDRMSSLSVRQRRSGSQIAVLFCDVDLLKNVNDTFGHAAGDELLREVAVRINSCIRQDDMAARVGGDEMLVLLKGVHDLHDAVDVAEKIRASMAEPVRAGEAIISASVSIGVALAREGESAEDLMARADAAMYRAKQEGRNQIVTLG
jgi:diguanylate cyclase (GGDEF)-like protein/PAS domain S-box-containing protein